MTKCPASLGFSFFLIFLPFLFLLFLSLCGRDHPTSGLASSSEMSEDGQFVSSEVTQNFAPIYLH